MMEKRNRNYRWEDCTSIENKQTIQATISCEALLLYIKFLPMVELFVVKHAKKLYLRRRKVKKMI